MREALWLYRSGFWIKIAALFLLRSGRSTAALSLMVVTAVAMLIFLSALAVGVNDAMIRNTVELYGGHISGFNLPATLTPEQLAIEGVSRRYQTRACRGHSGRAQKFSNRGHARY